MKKHERITVYKESLETDVCFSKIRDDDGVRVFAEFWFDLDFLIQKGRDCDEDASDIKVKYIEPTVKLEEATFMPLQDANEFKKMERLGLQDYRIVRVLKIKGGNPEMLFFPILQKGIEP